METMTLPRGVDLEWIQSRCKIEGDCWIWNCNSQNGYGKIYRRTKGKRQVYPTHRVSLALFTGEMRDLQVCHRPGCSSLCCNPRHLSWGSQKDNNHDTAYVRGTRPKPFRNQRGTWVVLLPKDLPKQKVDELVDQAYLASEGFLPWEELRPAWKAS